jgi:hypothetical protein
MPEQGARYAVYFVPCARSALYRFGSAVIGYDCRTGGDVTPPDEIAADIEADIENWRRLTAEPRRYGFHATLKAPFRLAPRLTEAALVSAFFDFAGRTHEVAQVAPEVRLLGGFAAIVPRERSTVLAALADACTTAFDAFRASMAEPERERRIASGLSERQIRNLDRWGYPYVFDDFRFHMTLTGQLPVAQREQVLALLRAGFAKACGDRPIAIDRLALVKQQEEQARFRVLCQAELGR